MTYTLFLDDERLPVNPDAKIARSFEEFLDTIERFGWPNEVNFDHDLGPDQPTGYAIAKYIIECDLDDNVLPEDFKYTVHSQNPPGARAIKCLMDQYLSQKRSQNEKV